jgi:CheY-like chemotaxis protein
MNNSMQDLLSYCSKVELLYVEDNEEARQFTMELLSRFFKNIAVCENGQEALELFKEKKISLIMSDINMPKMDGIEMSQKIRDLNSDVPIVLLSAHNEGSFKDSANHAGVTDYLEKPLKLSKLIELLTSFANNKIGDK